MVAAAALVALLGGGAAVFAAGGGAESVSGASENSAAYKACEERFEGLNVSSEDVATMCELSTAGSSSGDDSADADTVPPADSDAYTEPEGYSDTEGYYEQPTYVQPQPTYQPPQPKTCLEWRTNYRYQPPPIHQFGQSPGSGSQIPTGQTCVRYG
jgi:hypothetical protein